MTTTALNLSDQLADAPHPDWCLRDRCKVNADGSITHLHLLGTVGFIEVYLERTDSRDDKGKGKAGPVETFSLVNSTGRLSRTEVSRLNRLQHQAAVMTGQRSVG